MRHEYRPDPLALFLTWTTYGSWLPGDDRGWADGAGVMREPSRRLARHAAALLRNRPIVLTSADREVVEGAIREQCRFRGWRSLAVQCRTAHVHVVVAASESRPDVVLRCLKAWASRELSSPVLRCERLWTRGGSVRRLYDEKSVENAVRYVVDGQDGPRGR